MNNKIIDILCGLEGSKVLFITYKYSSSSFWEHDGTTERAIESVTLHFDFNPSITIGDIGEQFWDVSE